MPLLFLGMALVADLLTPSRARIDSTASTDLLGYEHSVVHVGQSVVSLATVHVQPSAPHRLLIITTLEGGVMPGGVCIESSDDFVKIRSAAAECVSSCRSVALRGWDRNKAVFAPVDLTLSAREIGADAIHALWRNLASRSLNGQASMIRRSATESFATVSGAQKIRAYAPDLVAAASDGRGLGQLLIGLVGAGPGTTPTGDDLIVGVLAALDTTGSTAAARRLRAAVAPLLTRTTAASRHYLASAIDGRFGEHVHALVRRLEKSASAETTIELASRWGATSGIDLLTGLASGLLYTVQVESAA